MNYQGSMPQAPLEHVEIWRGANRLYPQSQNGFAGILGPHIVRDLFSGSLELDIIRQLMIPNGVLDEIIAEAEAIHARLGILCEVTSGSVNQQWRATGGRVLSVLGTQVDEIANATKDETLFHALSIRTSANVGIKYFISDKKYERSRETVQDMWDIAADTLKNSASKKHAATITRTLVSMHVDMVAGGHGQDLRQAQIIAPEWVDIKSDLQEQLQHGLSGRTEYDPSPLIELFVGKLILGNKPQRATRKLI